MALLLSINFINLLNLVEMSTQTKKEIEEQKAAVAASVEGQQVAAEGVGQEQPAEQKKKRRRGITNDTRATSRLKFDERRDANRNNFLFLGHLDNIELTWVTLGAEIQGMQSFAGCAIPVLVLTFASNDENESVRRYVTHRMMPAESNALTIPGGAEAWKVDSVLGWMKHVMDVFVLKGRPMTETEEDALTLSFEDSDEDGNYVPVEAEEVINGWKTIFENFLKIMNNDGKPVYKTANGAIIPIWMKLLRFTKVRGTWAPVVRGKSTMGDLGFTNFVGEGCIELYKNQVAPMLKVDGSKESIVYKEVAKPAAPAIPNAPMMGGVMAGAPAMPGMPTADANANNFGAVGGFPGTGNPADDLPF